MWGRNGLWWSPAEEREEKQAWGKVSSRETSAPAIPAAARCDQPLQSSITHCIISVEERGGRLINTDVRDGQREEVDAPISKPIVDQIQIFM